MVHWVQFHLEVINDSKKTQTHFSSLPSFLIIIVFSEGSQLSVPIHNTDFSKEVANWSHFPSSTIRTGGDDSSQRQSINNGVCRVAVSVLDAEFSQVMVGCSSKNLNDSSSLVVLRNQADSFQVLSKYSIESIFNKHIRESMTMTDASNFNAGSLCIANCSLNFLKVVWVISSSWLGFYSLSVVCKTGWRIINETALLCSDL
mmetsp:Transcript_19153/g.26806  ORF Transcript_19153/g.26806 Transcript_19153/m.26806 type:complete len:202 (-) Transcript_19153:95-700(-)